MLGMRAFNVVKRRVASRTYPVSREVKIPVNILLFYSIRLEIRHFLRRDQICRHAETLNDDLLKQHHVLLEEYGFLPSKSAPPSCPRRHLRQHFS
jgi:hypothetical protein